MRLPSDGDTATGQVLGTGQPLRVDSYEGTSLAEITTDLSVQASVTVPILVEGRAWGMLSTSTAGPPLTVGTEDRLMQFAELAAAAIANAENKAKLTVSRARVVATADETRRRLQRDVHDGAQQRLVHALLAFGIAREAAADGRPAAELIDEAIRHAERANSELRDLVRGILPASLTRGGLRTAVESLVSDMPVPHRRPRDCTAAPSRDRDDRVLHRRRRALTNVVKHAHATCAIVTIRAEGLALSIEARDDGSGGADPAQGTGLTGLLDRVEASDGTLTITSPPTIGTTLHVTLPLGISTPDHRPLGQSTSPG